LRDRFEYRILIVSEPSTAVISTMTEAGD